MAIAALKMSLQPIIAQTSPHARCSADDARSSPVVIERDGQKAWLHVPEHSSGRIPLLVVLHGAGKDSMWTLKEGTMSVDAWAARARSHGIAVLYPAARGSTWDFISSGRKAHADVEFIAYAINSARRTVAIDDRRIALLGLSDGGSMALSLACHNPTVFQAAIAISAGFCAAPPRVSHTAPRPPKLFLRHGAADAMFPLERVGLPLRDSLMGLGYDVEHHIGQGEGGMFGPAGHVPPGWHEEFLPAWLATSTA